MSNTEGYVVQPQGSPGAEHEHPTKATAEGHENKKRRYNFSRYPQVKVTQRTVLYRLISTGINN